MGRRNYSQVRQANKLQDIITLKRKGKHFSNIELTSAKYACNMAVFKDEDTDDTWFIANNISGKFDIREYKKRFDIEEMFKDFKSNLFTFTYSH